MQACLHLSVFWMQYFLISRAPEGSVRAERIRKWLVVLGRRGEFNPRNKVFWFCNIGAEASILGWGDSRIQLEFGLND